MDGRARMAKGMDALTSGNRGHNPGVVLYVPNPYIGLYIFYEL